MKKIIEKFSSIDKKLMKDITVGLVAVLIIFLVIFGARYLKTNILSTEVATTKVISFINTTLLNGQAAAKLEQISEENGLYKVKINVNGKSVDSYMTKDGSLFFPTAYKMSTSSDVASQDKTNGKPAATEVVKNDKPKVELFVMSYCPFGTQIEKGILPAVQALNDKIDFSLKFVDYAMHGQKELDENLRQYCIDKTQPTKLFPYLTCFLKSDNSTSCLGTTGVNQGSMNACVKSTDTQFKVTEQFTGKQNWHGNFPPFDVNGGDNTKYGVQGSPTLVINGSEVQAGARDSASLLKTICSAFTKQPEICNSAKLSSASPASGFGEGSQTGGAPAANCATN